LEPDAIDFALKSELVDGRDWKRKKEADSAVEDNKCFTK